MFNTITRKLRARNTYVETVRELQRMTNRELNDIGITRSDITSVARKAAMAQVL